MPSGVYKRTREHCENIRRALNKPEIKKKLIESHIGQVVTEETREKISKALQGKKKPARTKKAKESYRQRMLKAWRDGTHKGMTGKKQSKDAIEKSSGENSHFWKGGITDENESIRKSYAYKKWRKSVFKRDDYTCQICGTRGGELNADHIKPFATHPELRLELSNGRTLCIACHYETPTFGGKMHLKNRFKK